MALSAETKHQLIGIRTQLMGVEQDLFFSALQQEVPPLRMREAAETLEAMAKRLRRIAGGEE